MDIKVLLKPDEAVMRQEKDSNICATGWVELERAIKFPIRVIKYHDTEEDKEKMFVSYPSNKKEDGYDNVIYPEDKEIRAAINDVVMAELQRQLLLNNKVYYDNPAISDVRVTPLKEERSAGSVSIKAVASIKTCGMVIKGILVKEGSKGPFVQMPQRRSGNGEYYDVVYGVNAQMQQQIKDAVLEEYNKVLTKEPAPVPSVEPEQDIAPEPEVREESNMVEEQPEAETPVPADLSQIRIGNAEYQGGYLHFTVEANGYELPGLFRIYDPENGSDMTLVSIEDGSKHPIIDMLWKDIESGLQEKMEGRYKKLSAPEENRKNEYYKESVGLFTYYRNVETGKRKFELDKNDICVEGKPDDFQRPNNTQPVTVNRGPKM